MLRCHLILSQFRITRTPAGLKAEASNPVVPPPAVHTQGELDTQTKSTGTLDRMVSVPRPDFYGGSDRWAWYLDSKRLIACRPDMMPYKSVTNYKYKRPEDG